jgi:hypothetical protein
VDEVFFVPCANDGAGETVVMSGNIHFVAHFTFNDNTVSGMFFANSVNFSGTGQVTGDHYRRTGVSTSVFSESQQGSSFTTTSAFSFQLVGQGAGNNLVVHTLFHVTINAQGDTTVSLETLRADCK